jgi:Contractile injection system tape measure protein
MYRNKNMNKKNIFAQNKKNTINKIFFELEYAAQKENFLLPELTTENFYNHVLPIIEKVFEKVPPHAHVQIEKLEINIGVIKNMEDLELLLEAALQKNIDEHIIKNIEKGNKKSELENTFSDVKKEVSYQGKSEYDFIVYFLKNGLLPWYKNGDFETDFNRLIKAILEQKKLQNNDNLTNLSDINSFLSELETLLLSEIVRKRLVNNIDSVVIIALLAILKPSAIHKQLRDAVETIFSIMSNVSKAAIYYELLMNEFITIISTNSSTQNLKLQTFFDSKLFFQTFNNFIQIAATPAQVLSLQQLLETNKIKSLNLLFKKQEAKKTIGVIEQIPEDAILLNQNENNTIELEQQIEDGIFITNAGLVLLAPFLGFFFAELGLLKEGTFKSGDDAIKAAQILHYIVYGVAKTPEYMMVFNKVLCGIPINTALPIKLNITKKIKLEIQSLLENVILRWTALKNTSPQGFVHSFLQRKAILTKNENGWLLKVETKSIDVLLDTLPWNISMIKLKWNGYLIHTEWQ